MHTKEINIFSVQVETMWTDKRKHNFTKDWSRQTGLKISPFCTDVFYKKQC